ADEFDILFVNKVCEHADGIGTATHACNYQFWQTADALKHLSFGLGGDDAVEFAHNRGKWVWACRSAQQVVRLMEGCGPVAQSLIDGVFQCSSAGIDRNYPGAHQFHAEDIGLLAGNVFSSHVNHALEIEQRAR